MDLSEKKERIYQSYKESFDKKMAYKKVGVSDDEIKLIDSDAEFQDRLQFLLIEEKERIIRRFRNMAQSDNEQIALKANTELGKMLYPEMCDNLKDPGVNINVNVMTKEEEERINAEYGILLGGRDIFAKRNSHTQ